MQQKFDHSDNIEDFATPPWATRALFEHVILPLMPPTGRLRLRSMAVAEPAANRGYMARPLSEYFGIVCPSDIHDYGMGYLVKDYLAPPPIGAEWTITNPPFKLGEAFIRHSFMSPGWQGTAVFARIAFLEGTGRYNRVFQPNPPSAVAIFTERVVLHKGPPRDPDIAYFDPATGRMKKPSTATSYAWLVWMKDVAPRPTIWIPRCRKALTRPGDYDYPLHPATKETAL